MKLAYSWGSVCAPDADIVMSSSDGVLFKLHRRNLGIHSDIFPGVEPNVPVLQEVVFLAEKASILELLFSIYTLGGSPTSASWMPGS